MRLSKFKYYIEHLEQKRSDDDLDTMKLKHVANPQSKLLTNNDAYCAYKVNQKGEPKLPKFVKPNYEGDYLAGFSPLLNYISNHL